jgi:hypothetical protein
LTYERCFVVADNYLYEISEDGTATSLGQMSVMTNDSTPVYMAVNLNDQVMVCHSSASYIFQMGAETLTQIVDADFPANPTYLSYSQGYFFVTAGGRVYYSNLNSGTAWTATDLFTPTAYADATVAAVVWRDDIHCFGTETIEIYINDGVTPFIRQDRSTINIGVVSVDTIRVFHEGIIFLGKARNGQKNVYYYNGQTCTVISSPSIAWAINNPVALAGTTWENLLTYTWDMWFDAWGLNENNSYAEIQYSKDGHIFYYLTIPGLNTTYVFDMIVQEWVERQSAEPTSLQQKEFRGVSMVNFKGTNLWTDKYTGKVLYEDFTVATENSNAITRTRISKFFNEEKHNLSIFSFELDCTTGVGLIGTPATTANIALYYSRDGGNTYQTPVNLSTGAVNVFTQRPRVNKLGTARDWVFKLVVTDAANLAISQAIINGTTNTY